MSPPTTPDAWSYGIAASTLTKRDLAHALCPVDGGLGLDRGGPMFYGARMSSNLPVFKGSITDAVRAAIEAAIEGATAEVSGGGGGHVQIVVTSPAFAGKSMLESQRLVYSAIAHLMAGDAAPVHAVDSLKTRTP